MRRIYFLSFLTVSFLLLISLYLEYFEGVIPCPLCTLQRLTFCLLGILFFFGIFFHTKFWGRTLINSFSALTAILGLLLSGRQIWIQHFQLNSNADCEAGIGYMLQTFPMNEVIKKIIFEGGVECSKRGFEFLHFNMAEWAFIWFFLFLLLISYFFVKELTFHFNHHHRRHA